eukprot:9491264-Pyramimonas_sp.AAC.1
MFHSRVWFSGALDVAKHVRHIGTCRTLWSSRRRQDARDVADLSEGRGQDTRVVARLSSGRPLRGQALR